MAVDMSREAVSQRLDAMGDLWMLSVQLMNSVPTDVVSGRTNRTQAHEIVDSIRRILLCDWDPIGVSDARKAGDEYDEYISPVYRILVGTRFEGDLVGCLRRIELEGMGIRPGDPAVLHIVAEKLLNLNVTLN